MQNGFQIQVVIQLLPYWVGTGCERKLMDPTSIIIDAKSGTSGAGRKPTRMNMHAEMSENFKIYKVNEHQHIPEIEQQL